MAEFLVVYDYGTGGVWGFASGSKDEITRLFPFLKVLTERPEWMSEDEESEIRRSCSFLVGDEATYPDWLKALR